VGHCNIQFSYNGVQKRNASKTLYAVSSKPERTVNSLPLLWFDPAASALSFDV
jgi:hypothetical protein